jgi:hypothetical protein
MAKYVEYIKVGSGESWPVRDAEAQESILVLNNNVDTLNTDVEGLRTTASELESDVKLAASDAGAAKELANQALPKTGGTMTGPLILTAEEHYGPTLPDPGTIGRIFFKVVESE